MTNSFGHESTPFDDVITVLIVEDDAGDALLVSELLRDSIPDVDVWQAASLAAALEQLGGQSSPTCVVLDLGLPDAVGTAGVVRLVAASPGLPIVVLTGANDSVIGIDAVAAGAQDYLVKGSADAETLGRAVRYAIERCRADDASRRLFEAERMSEENKRLERGLLPQPLLLNGDDRVVVRYRPGSAGAQLGGDFYDAIEFIDGHLHVLIGDVAGHGPDEAALGVCLRVAWRALTLAGLEQSETMALLDQVLRTERTNDSVFTTVLTLAVSPDGTEVDVCSAGHPLPAILDPAPYEVVVASHGPLLGIFDDVSWPITTVSVPSDARILLFTDGLVEGYAQPGSAERLGTDEILVLLDDVARADDVVVALDQLLYEVERRNGAPLADDVALCLIRTGR